MMRILAIDTATEACSAALLVDETIHARYELAPQQHARLILPMMEALLVESGCTLAQLDGLAFGRGPGSFTGVRIAASVIQGLAFATDLPVVGISTLAALAQQVVDEHQASAVLTAFDARMEQVYWGAYWRQESGLVQLQGEEQVCDPHEVPMPEGRDWVAAGSGWSAYGDVLARQVGMELVAHYPQAMPHARGILRLAQAAFMRGEGVAAEQAQPVYLRNNVANKAKPA